MKKSQKEQTVEQTVEPTNDRLQQLTAHRAQVMLELGQVTWSRIQVSEEAARLEKIHVGITNDLALLDNEIKTLTDTPNS